MNDRFLFRGKRLDNGEWIQGALVHSVFIKEEDKSDIFYILNTDNIEYDCFEDLTEGYGYYEIDSATRGQCTGMCEKDGTLIFEGDILDNPYSSDALAVAEWIEGGFFIKNIRTGSVKPLRDLDICFDKLQLLGNIHDNPKLLTA